MYSWVRAANDGWPDVQFFAKANGLGVQRSLHINNTPGYEATLGYEYRNKRRYTFSAGILFGAQKLSYNGDVAFKHIDTAVDFKGLSTQYEVRTTVPYAGISIFLGRDYIPFKNKRIVIQGKIGLSNIVYLKEVQGINRLIFNYQVNDTFFRVNFANVDLSKQKGLPGYTYYTFYLGGSYTMPTGFIKEYRVGLIFTHAFGFFQRDSDFVGGFSTQYFNKYGALVGGEDFWDRFRNIGITIGFAF